MRSRIAVAALFAAGLLMLASDRAPVVRAQPRVDGRTFVALSDLHMGVGRTGSTWHPYEDFRWTDDFTAFLKAVDAEGRSAVDLVFNGDTFELTESTLEDCIQPPTLGCTEAEALARFDRVLAAHRSEIAAIRQFAQSGSNRVVFVPGDRDAALTFPGLATRLVGALAAPAGRVEVADSGYWSSPDGRVYSEHGHQIGFSADRFEPWPAPFARAGDRQHLVRPWGEQLLGTFQKQYEERYPVIDNVAAAGVGVKYVLAAEGVTDLGAAAPQLLRYLLFAISWQQFRMDLDGGEVEPPIWDVSSARAQGADFLAASVADDDPVRPLAAKALVDGRLAVVAKELTDDEIVAICDYRAAMRRARRRMERIVTQFPHRGPAPAECPRTAETRDSAFEYFWRSRDQVFMRRIEAANKRVPDRRQPIAVLVHGHTHLPDRSQSGINELNGEYRLVPEGFSPVRRASYPVAINGGAWQRTVTPVQLEQLKIDRGGVSTAELMRSLQPEQLDACYSFVQIDPYTDTPAPRVRYWSRRVESEGAIAGRCSQ